MEIVDYLDLLSKKTNELNATNRSNDNSKMLDISDWFGQQLKEREGVFKSRIRL
jgi:hypothetical protein